METGIARARSRGRPGARATMILDLGGFGMSNMVHPSKINFLTPPGF